MLAPITRRMLISFCFCCVVNAVSPSNPRQVIMMVSMENAAKIFPRFWSAAYCELKSSSKNLYSNGNWGKYFFQIFSACAIDALIWSGFSFTCMILLLGE